MLQRLASCQQQANKLHTASLQLRNWTFTGAPSNIYYIMFLFVMFCLFFCFHFGTLFKTLKEPCSVASQRKEWRERGYATVGTKHVCQREVFLLDI